MKGNKARNKKTKERKKNKRGRREKKKDVEIAMDCLTILFGIYEHKSRIKVVLSFIQANWRGLFRAPVIMGSKHGVYSKKRREISEFQLGWDLERFEL